MYNSKMFVYIKFMLTALAPVAFTALFFKLETSSKAFKSLKPWTRQIIFGAAFGALAVFANEFGIKIGNATVNVRDAAVLCAGLIFGWPAGIIAGVVGGIERFFSPFAPIYTRDACAAATILAGLTGAFMRKFIFNDKRPAFYYGFLTALVVEVFHMLMLIITHSNDAQNAFDLVRALTLPMALTSAASVCLSILATNVLAKERIRRSKEEFEITERIQFPLLLCVFAFFAASSIFTVFYERRWALDHISQDVKKIITAIDANLAGEIQNRTKNIRIEKDGVILILEDSGRVVSGPDEYLGTNIFEEKLSKDFLEKKAQLATHRVTVDKKPCYIMFKKNGSHWILALISKAEVTALPDISIYVSIFMDTLTFFVLFLLVFIIVKILIARNVDKIAASLKKITAGNLNERVNVRENKEFASLSDGINQTVQSLKENLNKVAAQAEKELQFAQMIQASAMPSVFPAYPGREEFDIYAKMIPAKEVGGDFYDFYFAGDEKLAILVADVSGKGVPSAMFMMRAKTLLKSLIESGLSPAEVFEKANNSLAEGNDAGMFLSAWLGIVDLKKGSVTYANAGHKMPLLLREYEDDITLDSDKNFILGGMEGLSYKESQIALQDNDTIFLFTDGILEAQDKSSEYFGEKRLLDSLKKDKKASCKDICENLVSCVEDFRNETRQEDDIALLCFRFKCRSMTGAVEYNDVVEQAVEFALKAHRDEKRKSNGIPYILHPIEVSAISSRLTMEREVMAAALLHDTVEDAGVTKEQLQKKFGDRVTELVMAETEDKHREMSAAASWQTRKEESIKDLRATNDTGVKAMWLSDKLSNLRSLYDDWRKKGDGVWQVFNQKDPAKHAWLYMSIIECMGDFKDTPEYKEYINICQEVFGSDWTFKG